MDWFFKLVRIAGVNFPGAASLVQLQAEIDSEAMTKRIEKLSDPISSLHENVQIVAREIYQNLKEKDSNILYFSDDFYSKYSRALAALDSSNLIEKINTAGSRFPIAITLSDASFVMYMCNLEEDPEKMAKITSIVDSCEVGTWLNGTLLSQEIGLPVNVIRAIFSIYEAKGYGLLSKTLGSCQYMGNA